MDITPFKIDVPQARVEQILSRLKSAHWAASPQDAGDWRYGTEASWLRDFVDYWIGEYDWRAAQDRLNRWPQFIAQVNGIPIHFYHVEADPPATRTLILTHGWPGSVLEFQNVIDPLVHPERHGGSESESFNLVIPSLPGYGFSGKPPSPMGPRAIANIWRKLMVEGLDYSRFGAQGGDWGSAVSTWLGADHSDVVPAIHLNMIASWVAAASPPSDPDDHAYREKLLDVQRRESGYSLIQATKPQTVGLALADTPLGFAAWVIEKFRSWSDCGGDLESSFSKDTLITNLMLYLINDAAASSLWLYWGRADEAAAGIYEKLRVNVPTGVALYPAEFIPYPPRIIAERYYDIRHWQKQSDGGHFAALERPRLFSDDVRRFFLTYL